MTDIAYFCQTMKKEEAIEQFFADSYGTSVIIVDIT